MTFTSANDDARRDPRTWELAGSNTGIDGPWIVIASGQVVDFIQAAEWPRNTKTTTPILFLNNTTPYDYYRVLFPTIRDSGANMMQIAEIEILDGTLVSTPELIVSFVYLRPPSHWLARSPTSIPPSMSLTPGFRTPSGRQLQRHRRTVECHGHIPGGGGSLYPSAPGRG
jgi:hypothetical protein